MDRKYNFAFTIGAVKEICERCPDRDIERIQELFNEDNYIDMLDNMTWFICVLSKWSVFKETRSYEGALTEDDVMVMDMDEIRELFDQAMGAFRKDKDPETEVKAVGKKTEEGR